MKKIYTFLAAMVMCSSLGWAKDYTVKASPTTFDAGTVLSDSGDPITVRLESTTQKSKDAKNDAKFPDGTWASELGGISILMNRSKDAPQNAIRVILDVTQTVSDVKIYYTGDEKSYRFLTLDEYPYRIDYGDQTTIRYNDSSELGFVAYINTLPKGKYYICSDDYKGGFAGMKYSVRDDASKPSNPGVDAIDAIDKDAVWDFNEIEISSDKIDYNGTSEKDTWHSYAYLYNNNK